MCGIVGILRTDGTPASRESLESALSALSHRGPDGWGIEARGSCALGHRRLSIIDLEGGRQPMSDDTGRYHITFNGEIYNFRELRDQLSARGYRFRTQSDTEVILYAYREWGEACVERFRGMFAFALLDEVNGLVFLARDQLGIKPLYYASAPGIFAFASELQALRGLPGLRLTLDPAGIDAYLQLQYIPAPLTAFREARKLPPAHRMTIPLRGEASPEPAPYWALRFASGPARREEEWVEALDAVLRDSVRAHLVSDVPFGAFLSGGVDSSAVVAYMAQVLDKPVLTFSIGFEEERYNELPYAREAASRWGTRHHEEIVRPDALAILPDLVRHYGEPFGDSSALPTYYVCRMARRHVPMVLSGDGGDEAFAGYASYFQWLDWIAGRPRSSWRDKLRAGRDALRGQGLPGRRPVLANWLRFVGYMPAPFRRKLWRPEFRADAGRPVEPFAAAFAAGAGLSPLRRAQLTDFGTYLPGDILAKVDVASMMHGLEARTPFIDVKVAEFAATLPEDLLISRSGGAWQGKRLLKKAMASYYPASFLERPKMGFATPLSKWFGSEGALSGHVRERLLGRDSALGALFRPEAIAPLVGSEAHGLVWLLLFLEEWLRQNPPDALP